MQQISTPVQLFHDKKRNLAIYRTTQSGLILSTISESRGLDNAHVAVPLNHLPNAQIARHLGLPVPPPISDENYDWPCMPGIKPLEHQKVTANFCVLHPKCFVLSDMGTMKTLSCLWAADWLMRKYPGMKCLVVAPLSTLHVVWGSAIFKHFIGRRTYEILDGKPEKRIQGLRKARDFYIVNFDGAVIGSKGNQLDGFSREIFDRKDIGLVIVDEATAYKHANTRRHRIARKLFDRPYLWLLTGTPTAQTHLDAYGLARLVNQAHGESYGSFVNRTTVQLSRFKRIPTRTAYEEARKLLTPAIRYDIRDVWDGPPLTTQQRQVDLTAEQKKHLKDLRNQLVVAMQDGTMIVPANEAALRTKYLQIVLGAVYDGKHTPHPIDSAPRIAELINVLDQSSSKVLVLAPFTSIVELLYRSLDRWDRAIVTGATLSAERREIFNAFQTTDKPQVIIADPGCLAHGIDLFAATTTVWYGPTDKNELYEQANKRAHRPGQRFPVTVVQMVATALEREIFARLQRNQQLQGVLLNMIKEGKI